MLDKQSFISLLNSVFAANGRSGLLNLEKSEKFFELTVRMLEENEKYNLTAIKEVDKIVLNHYLDCAMLSSYIKKGATILDVGCGAGFPTLPLAIVREDLTILGMDSTAKRISYVNETATMLGLSGVKAVTMRAEDGARLGEYRESFDYVTARAVAELRILSELCLPYVRVGGQFIAMKGKNAEFELAGAKKAISILGGRNQHSESIELKGQGETFSHPLIIIDKKEKTPSTYPRPYAQISKKPL